MIRLWRLLGYPARLRLLLALVLSAAAGCFGIVLMGLSGWFLTAAALAGASGAGYVFNHLYPSAGVRASAFGRVLTRYGEQIVGHDATLSLSAELRPRLFAASAASQRGFAPMPAKELSTLIDDVDAAEAGFLRVFSPAAAILASMLVALGFAFAADAAVGSLTLVLFALAGFLFPFLAVKRTQQAASELASRGDAVRERTARLVENAVELDIVGALGRESSDVLQSLDDWIDLQDRIDAPYRRLGILTGLFGGGAALFMLWRALSGEVDLALAVGAALATIAAFDATAAMVKILEAVNRSGLAARRLADRIEQEETPWNTARDRAKSLETVFPLKAEGLKVRAASSAPEIGPLSFEIGPGEIVQLVGPSGCGKTTVAESLMRLQPLIAGTLSYGPVACNDVRIASVLRRIAIAPQLPAFLPGTLADQLRLANPEATEDEMTRALKTACALDFVTRRGDGLETWFSEDRLPFSGGELRRIGIARALLADPDLLILDEPLAGLQGSLGRKLSGHLAAWAGQEGRSLLVLVHEEQDWSAEGLHSQVISVNQARSTPAMA